MADAGGARVEAWSAIWATVDLVYESGQVGVDVLEHLVVHQGLLRRGPESTGAAHRPTLGALRRDGPALTLEDIERAVAEGASEE